MSVEPEGLGSFITLAYHPQRGKWVLDIGDVDVFEALGVMETACKVMQDTFEFPLVAFCNGGSVDADEDEEKIDDDEDDSEDDS
jgi:hypothetical protein